MENNNAAINQQILKFTGHNSFILSLKDQLIFKGYLSEKQRLAANKFFNPKETTPNTTINYTYSIGDLITIRTWFARRCKSDYKLPYFFRNLKIIELFNETNKAIQVKVSFQSKVANCCHFCGKGLDTEISRVVGIGPVWGKKYLKVNKITKENAQAVLDKIEAEAKNAGDFGPIWIPKSQIMSEAEVILFEKD